MNKYTEHYKTLILGNLSNLKIDIENCSDELWEKKVGGDYYWDQVYHALTSLMMLLKYDGAQPYTPIKDAGMLDGKTKAAEIHSKDLMLKVYNSTIEYVEKYFKTIDDKKLLSEVDFFGDKMPLGVYLGIVASHIFYHVGACDVALRDNGCKSSL